MMITTIMHAGCYKEKIENKIYVNHSSVFVEENGIFVEIDNQLLQFSAVNRDENGIYVLPSEYNLMGEWYCEKGHLNNQSSVYCRFCGRW